MAQQRGTTGAADAAPTGSAAAPMVVLGISAAVLFVAITLAASHGYSIVIPVNILGGFSFNVAPLLPAATALILAFGLWRYSGLSQGKAWLAALCIFVAPILFVQIWNALTGFMLNLLPNSVVTNSQNFYGILFAKGLVSVVGIMLVMAIAARPFRAWSAWLWLAIVWAGGDVLLFGLYRNWMFSRDVYQWLYIVERILGFIVLGWYFRRPPRPATA
jgi:flagellar biosynthesis protein FlhB